MKPGSAPDPKFCIVCNKTLFYCIRLGNFKKNQIFLVVMILLIENLNLLKINS